jgi:hypothetical protein
LALPGLLCGLVGVELAITSRANLRRAIL